MCVVKVSNSGALKEFENAVRRHDRQPKQMKNVVHHLVGRLSLQREVSAFNPQVCAKYFLATGAPSGRLLTPPIHTHSRSSKLRPTTTNMEGAGSFHPGVVIRRRIVTLLEKRNRREKEPYGALIETCESVCVHSNVESVDPVSLYYLGMFLFFKNLNIFLNVVR